MRKILLGLLVVGVLAGGLWWGRSGVEQVEQVGQVEQVLGRGEVVESVHPLSIEYLRRQEYPGSDLVIERELERGSNYSRYLASYSSEGLKIFGLLTMPDGEAPEGGWPGIIFNHGWIPPEQYVPWERYVAYVEGFARQGYVVFRPDYRGHWESEGIPEGAYGSNGYSIDVLNAFASLQQHPEVNAEKIGMWGHSLGGFLALRAAVVNPDIQAVVIWGGVVGSYQDIYEKWWLARAREREEREDIPARWRRTRSLIADLRQNAELLEQLSANTFLNETEVPIQLHHATGDETVPVVLSQDLAVDLEELGREYEYHEYVGDNHNISSNFSVAMRRSVEYFDRYLSE